MLENYTKLIICSLLDLGPVADLHTVFHGSVPLKTLRSFQSPMTKAMSLVSEKETVRIRMKLSILNSQIAENEIVRIHQAQGLR
jgi:hypothetical protein